MESHSEWLFTYWKYDLMWWTGKGHFFVNLFSSLLFSSFPLFLFSCLLFPLLLPFLAVPLLSPPFPLFSFFPSFFLSFSSPRFFASFLPSFPLFLSSLFPLSPSFLFQFLFFNFRRLMSLFLQGTISKSIGILTKLNTLWDFLECFTWDLSYQRQLDLNSIMHHNRAITGTFLTGTIPSEIGNLIEIQRLYKISSSFSFSEEILWIRGIKGRRSCSISHLLGNYLAIHSQEQFPQPLESWFWLNTCNFHWPFTSWTNRNASPLQYHYFRDLSQNFLNGNIPTEMGLLSSLQDLLGISFLSTFAGVPFKNQKFKMTRYLSLNELTGSLPDEFSNLTILKTLFDFNV